MRSDAHLESHEPPPHPVQQDIPWMVAFAALMVFLFFALNGSVRNVEDLFGGPRAAPAEQSAPASSPGR
jgi:hypothetical protein